MTEVSLDASAFRLLVYGPRSGPDYAPLVRNDDLLVTYFADAELMATEWRPQDVPALRALRGRTAVLGSPDEMTKRRFVEARRLFDQLGFSRAQRNHTDLWIIAQTAQEGLALASHDRSMLRIADALRIETITLLAGIDAQLTQDRLRLARQPPR